MKEGFKTIQVYISEENAKFISSMAKRDSVTTKEEMRMIFFTELDHLKDLYLEEVE